ncbi:MAG: CpsD/CapB family tyrosine-protein kinase [Clostridia bacterium]|nr:CpsD/CapB family tyrosine-protein kinase [Clostridia bacterium]
MDDRSHKNKAKAEKTAEPKTIELIFAELPFAINEEMKALRTNIQFCGKDKRVILLTSAVQNEGKTTLALNLCRSFAELNKSVLMVDADMRKSIIKNRLRSGKIGKGLSHYLSGQCEMPEIFFRDETANIQLLPAGSYPPNPVELLAGEEMQTLIRDVRERFDYVVIDCAPLGVVTDAAVLAPICDGVVIVLNAGEVHYKLAQQVVTKLQNTGCAILGVVLNQLNHQSNGRYYGKKYGYYKRYGRYGYYKRYGNYYYRHEYESPEGSSDKKSGLAKIKIPKIRIGHRQR